MKAQLHLHRPELLGWPRFFWQEQAREILARVFEFAPANSDGSTPLHVFVDAPKSQISEIKDMPGRKILICAEYSGIAPEAHSFGNVFSRDWDRVFTWNQSLEGENLRHFHWPSPQRLSEELPKHSAVFAYYGREAALSLACGQKLERMHKIKLTPINLNTFSHANAASFDAAQAVVDCTLAWHEGFASPLATFAREKGIPYCRLGWTAGTRPPFDSLAGPKRVENAAPTLEAALREYAGLSVS
jgi:hypothetical protein